MFQGLRRETNIMMTYKENYLRTVRFERPDYIPVNFVINDSCWHTYPQEALLDLMESHPLLFPNYKRPKEPIVPNYAKVAQKDHPYRDDFGCVWETTIDGITGTVTKHPLADWENFKTYKAPDPEVCMGIGPIDWEKIRNNIESTPDALHGGGLRHGHTFLQLSDIRGYEDLLCDMLDEEPLLWNLIALVENFNYQIIKHYVDMNVDVMSYGEDLGMQVGPMLSPECFRKYIKPSYMRLMKPAKDAGILIHMHSDGDVRLLLDDMLDCGINIINIQDLVNGIDWIQERLAGKYCIDLDVDRQKITPYGSPKEIDDLVREEVTKLGSRDGGLMMVYGLYPGVPLENAKALMDALERYMGYFD